MSPVRRTIDDEFQEAVEDWKEHCERNSFSSMTRKFLECDAYPRIVAMGPAALPLIRRVYDADTSDDPDLAIVQLYIAYAVQGIVGKDFFFPEGVNGHASEIRGFTARWLDENMEKYMSK